VGAKANWFVDAVAGLDDQPDPFAAPIEEVGERIDLLDPKATLSLRLTELLGREASLDRHGIVCPIKDRADSTCHACPVSKASDPTADLSTLCRVGREQETVMTELAVLACRDE
jgi:hypothetical protein